MFATTDRPSYRKPEQVANMSALNALAATVVALEERVMALESKAAKPQGPKVVKDGK